MKELTAAQGKLRCGECGSVFNAMDSLSTKLPEQLDPVKDSPFDALDDHPKQPVQIAPPSPRLKDNKPRRKSTDSSQTRTLASIALTGLLASILIAQIWLTRDIWLNNARQPDKVKLLSRKVFSHPSQTDALVITGAIENTADRSQPYPYLETRLLDANNQIVALRRFRPHEYLETYEKDSVLGSHQKALIKLKIQDPPGNRAKQFKFSFL